MPLVLECVRRLGPMLVVVENVEGLTYAKHTAYLAWFVESLRALGYRVDGRVLNAADYGVAQTRKRLFIVGRREGDVRWPRASHAKAPVEGQAGWVSMAEALGWTDLEVVVNTGNDWKPGMERAYAQKRAVSRPAPSITGKSGQQWVLQPGSYADGREGGVGKRRLYGVDEPAPTVCVGKDVAAWVWRRPATTVQGDTRIHPPGHRANRDYDGHPRRGPDALRLSVGELALLQDMPADWPFAGSKTSAVRQVGNCCPPRFIEAVVGANLWPPRWNPE